MSHPPLDLDRLRVAFEDIALFRSQSGGVGWQLAPAPFILSAQQYAQLQALGPLLWRYIQAVDQLYQHSVKGNSPTWVAEYCHLGKPDALLQLARNRRFRKTYPTVLRPDLLLTDGGFALTELDAVPGGLGFLAALNHAYREAGATVIEPPEHDLPSAFMQMLRAEQQTQGLADDGSPPVVVVSDEASDYRPEWEWLTRHLQEGGQTLRLLTPQSLTLLDDRLAYRNDAGQWADIRMLYRFFELFDLPNIPKMPLVQYAVQKGLTACTPGFRPHLEEKLWLALLHHPVLQADWQALLLVEDLTRLQQLTPPGWVVDPRPLPPSAVIPGLTGSKGRPVNDFTQLAETSQSERQLVLKPSGFSPNAWGSRGVVIGHDISQAAWADALQHALSRFWQEPHILQQFYKPLAHAYETWQPKTGAIKTRQGRTRLCPYYLVTGQTVTLAGILATTCPADKKIIHGMQDAVLAPCRVESI